jgi:hypothetical protein
VIDHPAYAAASPEVRAAALALLDEISEPLHPHAIERRFQDGGLTRGQARKAKHALSAVNVIALVPR